ncbi:hypothetical protein QG37_03171 [Candidozyma auris]|nr:hypothetical protein QG37_03171 [[Candida] auris]
MLSSDKFSTYLAKKVLVEESGHLLWEVHSKVGRKSGSDMDGADCAKMVGYEAKIRKRSKHGLEMRDGDSVVNVEERNCMAFDFFFFSFGHLLLKRRSGNNVFAICGGYGEAVIRNHWKASVSTAVHEVHIAAT